MTVLVAIQLAGIVSVVWAVQRIGEMWSGPKCGAWASWLTALYFPLYLHASCALTESLFITLSVWSIYAFCLGALHKRILFFTFAGMLAALAIGQRSVGIVLPAVFIIMLVIPAGIKRLRFAMACFGGLFAVLFVLMAINLIHYEHFRLVAGTGAHLFGRVAQVDKWLPDTAEARLIQQTAAQAGMDTPLVKEGGWIMQELLSKLPGMDQEKADSLLRKVAIQSLTSRPWSSVRLTVSSMDHMVTAYHPNATRLFLRPEQYADFEAYPWRLASNHRDFEYLWKKLPGYSPPQRLGYWPFAVGELWGHLSKYGRGRWVLFAMGIGIIVGCWKRNVGLLGASLAAALQLAASACGDQPDLRYWDPATPFFFLMIAQLLSYVLIYASRWKHVIVGKEEVRAA